MSFSTTLRAVLLMGFVLLLSVGESLAGTPFTRSLNRGRRYVHRPYCKQYKKVSQRGLFARR